MQNLFQSAAPYRWDPDADEVGAPTGSLLRADNTVPDEKGARALRMGSAKVYSGFQDLRVQSLYTAELRDSLQRMAGAGNRVYANGALVGGEDFDGSGDIVFGDDAYQIFAARGQTRKKWDGTDFNNWSIDAPIIKPTVAAVNAITTQVASFDSTESPAFTTNEGTPSFQNGYDGTANGGLKLVPAATGRASTSKKFASDQDYLDIGGSIGGNTDLFDFRVYFEDWRKVDKVTIMFGLGTGTDPYLDDYYYFDFNIRKQDTVNIKDAAANAASAFAIAGAKALNVLTPQQVTNIRSAAQAGEILKRLGRFAGPRSTERRDAQEASPAWGHLSVTRGQFNRVGGTAGRNWKTIRAFKIVYTCVPGDSSAITMDDAIWTGGGARSLTGNFTVGYRFARRVLTAASEEVYYELSPMSPVSESITLNQQTLQITISSIALSAKDPQVTEVWAYLQGGWLDTYYRFAILPATPSSGMTIDELASPVGSNFDTPEKRARLTTWGFTNAPGAGAGSTDVVFTGNLSELEILIDNESYVPGSMQVPTNIVAIAGPHNKRTYVLDSEGFLHPSGDAPSNFSAYHAIDLRKYGTPLWLARTSSGITAGFSKDIIRILGTGDESEDRVIVDLYGDPLNVGSPPISSAIMVDGNNIVYLAADGPMALNGATSDPIPFAGTSLLWRGKSRHGVEALNVETGRFRFEVDNHILYSLMPEGSVDPTAVWKFDGNQWMRATYPFNVLSIFREPSGRLLVGTDAGSVYEIETGEQDDGEDIQVDILTPLGDGGDPLRRKDAIDFQIHVDTGGGSGTASFTKEQGTVATSVPFTTLGPEVFRADLTALQEFLRSQVEITGSFSTFTMQAYNIGYRSRPQQVMVLDPGYIIPANGGDMAWPTEAALDCISPANLELWIYRDDVYYTKVPITVKPKVRTEYRVTLPRGTKSRRLRLITKTTNSSGADNPGFEPYSFKVRHRGQGNFTDNLIASGDAA